MKVDNGESIYLENLLLIMNRHGYEEQAFFTFSYSPIKDDEGHALGLFCAVVETTSQVQNKIELKKALDSRDEFLSIASHELRTPLTSLQLQTQVLKRKIDTWKLEAFSKDNVFDFTVKTEKQLSRLARLVDDMLDISRVRTGKLNIIKEEFDLSQAVKDVIAKLGTQIESAHYDLPLFESDGPIIGKWDHLRIEQVLVNLLTNALRYGEGKQIRLRLRLLNGLARLEVQDEGIGIEKNNQETIFQRYHRIPQGKDTGGLGLGLFLSRQIIGAYRGRIIVES